MFKIEFENQDIFRCVSIFFNRSSLNYETILHREDSITAIKYNVDCESLANDLRVKIPYEMAYHKIDIKPLIDHIDREYKEALKPFLEEKKILNGKKDKEQKYFLCEVIIEYFENYYNLITESIKPHVVDLPIHNQIESTPQQLVIPESILNELQEKRLITQQPLKWIGAVILCAYFTEIYLDRRWTDSENYFKVKNLRQSSDNYKLNKTEKPKNYNIIDDIVEKIKK